MPQMQLPSFPDGVERIAAELAFEKRDGQVTYFNGHMPVSIHAEEDTATFRMIRAQSCINGNATQTNISRAFGITLISVRRAVKRYRQRGPAGSYEAPRRRGPAVPTEPVLKQAQELLSEGAEITAVAEQLGLKRDTLVKAIRAGRLYKPTQQNDPGIPLSTKSQRSGEDAAAAMGMGACNVLDRLAASVGGIAAVAPACQAVSDVPNGGVLFALPAPLAVGLLHQTHRYFQCGLVHHTGLGNTVAQGSARDLDPKAVPWGQVRRPRKMGVAVSDGAAAAGSRKGPRPQAPWSER